MVLLLRHRNRIRLLHQILNQSHICGTILEGKEAFVQIAPRCTQVNPDYQLHIGEDYTVFFHNRIGLLGEDFPRPVIQMEVAMYIPWVLDEKDPYEH